jgi:mannose-6-phosphate isomerase-like protein (cupin superfamily)
MEKQTSSKQALFSIPASEYAPAGAPFAAIGQSIVVHEWKGSGPDYLHVHVEDDEVWHILEGALVFRFTEKTVRAVNGTTVFVPAGVAHSYSAEPNSRYLMILTPRLDEMIREMHASPRERHPEIMNRYGTYIV